MATADYYAITLTGGGPFPIRVLKIAAIAGGLNSKPLLTL